MNQEAGVRDRGPERRKIKTKNKTEVCVIKLATTSGSYYLILWDCPRDIIKHYEIYFRAICPGDKRRMHLSISSYIPLINCGPTNLYSPELSNCELWVLS